MLGTRPGAADRFQRHVSSRRYPDSGYSYRSYLAAVDPKISEAIEALRERLELTTAADEFADLILQARRRVQWQFEEVCVEQWFLPSASGVSYHESRIADLPSSA